MKDIFSRLLIVSLTIQSISFFSVQVFAQDNFDTRSLFLLPSLQVGDTLPDSLEVYTSDGERVKITGLLNEKPTAIVTGCITCPKFLRNYPAVEAVYRDYKDSVNFYYLYKTLAHPENQGYIQPISISERLAHIKAAKEKFQTRVPWLADPMTNEVSTVFGLGPNSFYLIDSAGQILYMTSTCIMANLRSALTEFAGACDIPTLVDSLHLPEFSARLERAENDFSRVQLNEIMIPVKIQPEVDDYPFYVKLRAEVSDSLMEFGSGKLYLGFNLDPVHNVHWNNLVDPLKYFISVPETVKIDLPRGRGPAVVGIPTDSHPREFLVNLENWGSDTDLYLEVIYYACHNESKWCKIVVQCYTITLSFDPYAGSVVGRSFKQRERAKKNKTSDKILDRFMSYDQNKDGVLTREEFPERKQGKFDLLDIDKNGIVERDEINEKAEDLMKKDRP